MKKLMIAAVAIAMAVCAQAAQLDWKTSGAIYHGNDSDLLPAGSLGYLIAVSGTDITAEKAIAALEGKGATDVATWISNNSIATQNKTANSSGKFAAATTAPEYTAGAYSFFAVIFDTDEITDASKFYVTSEKSATVPASGVGSASWTATNLADSKTSAGWHAVGAVPEPTSGLLLLLGVAGLALRRRRA